MRSALPFNLGDYQIGRINQTHCFLISMAVCLRWSYHYIVGYFHLYANIYNLGFCSIITVQSKMWANSHIHLGLKLLFVCLHITLPHQHHYIDWSEDIEHMKCLSCIFRWSIACAFNITSVFYRIERLWSYRFFRYFVTDICDQLCKEIILVVLYFHFLSFISATDQGDCKMIIGMIRLWRLDFSSATNAIRSGFSAHYRFGPLI